METIKRNGKPTSRTVGEIGQRYVDLDTNQEYTCMSINPCVVGLNLGEIHYTWKPVINSKLIPSSVTSWNNLTDKPFGEEPGLVVIQEGKQSGGPLMGAKEGYGDSNGNMRVSDFIPGDTYIVNVDGVDYTGVAERSEDPTSDGGNGIRLFDHGEYPEDFSDAPASFSSYSNVVYVTFEGDGYTSHYLKISHVANVITPIDKKYLPEGIGGSALPVYNADDLTTEQKIALAKEYKRYVTRDEDEEVNTGTVYTNLLMVDRYQLIYAPANDCCGNSEYWELKASTTSFSGSLVKGGWTINITEAQYNEILAAWEAMVGTEV